MVDINGAAELKAWIESRNATYPAVDDWDIRVPGDDTPKTYPALLVEPTGSEEHATLRGVMAPLSLDVRLETIPHEDGAAAEATTKAEHVSDADQLYEIIADRDAVEWIDSRGTIRCFDIRGSEPTLETEDGRRSSTVQVRMTCCNA